MTVLGGMGTLYGPMVGAGVYIGFEDVLSSYTDQWQLVLGTIFVAFVIFLPRGLVSFPDRLVGGRAPRASVRDEPTDRDEAEPLTEQADREVNE
jgi:branched-chain amino acid transport system permease protein